MLTRLKELYDAYKLVHADRLRAKDFIKLTRGLLKKNEKIIKDVMRLYDIAHRIHNYLPNDVINDINRLKVGYREDENNKMYMTYDSEDSLHHRLVRKSDTINEALIHMEELYKDRNYEKITKIYNDLTWHEYHTGMNIL